MQGESVQIEMFRGPAMLRGCEPLELVWKLWVDVFLEFCIVLIVQP